MPTLIRAHLLELPLSFADDRQELIQVAPGLQPTVGVAQGETFL